MSCGSEPSSYCSTIASTQLKLYQAFIFSVPVFITVLFLLLFYVFFLRRRRANRHSMRMTDMEEENPQPGILSSELGIKKEVREMLPVVVFKESFSIRETQCSVCLGDYKADERLHRIPSCGHTFHVDCIDQWLAAHSTCPLCRFSLHQATKSSINVAEAITAQPTLQLQEQPSASQTDATAAPEEYNGVRAVEGNDSGRDGEIKEDQGSHVAIDIEREQV